MPLVSPCVGEIVFGICRAVNGLNSSHRGFDIRERMQAVFSSVHGQQRARCRQSGDIGEIAQLGLGARNEAAVTVKNVSGRAGERGQRNRGAMAGNSTVNTKIRQ